MSLYNIAILGGGQLGSAIAKGLVKSNYPKEKVTIIQRNLEKGRLLQQDGFQVVTTPLNYASFDVIIIAVKSKDLYEVLRNIDDDGARNTAIISAVSGVSSEALWTILDNRLPLFRAKFSIFVEVKQEIIPIFLCNPRANEKFNDVKRILSFLGTPHVMPEAIMEMSGWELTSLPGIIFAQLIKKRLDLTASENAELAGRFMLSGLRSLLLYLEKESQRGRSLSETVDDLRHRIATPGGANEKMLEYLDEMNFWSLLSQARKVYQDRLEAPAS